MVCGEIMYGWSSPDIPGQHPKCPATPTPDRHGHPPIRVSICPGVRSQGDGWKDLFTGMLLFIFNSRDWRRSQPERRVALQRKSCSGFSCSPAIRAHGTARRIHDLPTGFGVVRSSHVLPRYLASGFVHRITRCGTTKRSVATTCLMISGKSFRRASYQHLSLCFSIRGRPRVSQASET